MYSYRGGADVFRRYRFFVDLSFGECQGSRRYPQGDRRYHYPCRLLCGLAESMGGIPSGKGSMERIRAGAEKDKYQNTILYPIGEPNNGFARYFTGQSYIAPVSKEQVGIFNVTFEPGCRNNWHIHHADKGGGQILICVGGRGYYQEWGKEAVEMKPGDCINIPVGEKHWHGAAPDSWFSHLAIEVPGENGSNEWLEPVDDIQYGSLK